MSTRLAKFNTLPPKTEHISKVRKVLKSREGAIKLVNLVAITNLSATQALCALEQMVRDGEVVKEKGVNTFQIVTVRET